MIGRLLLYSLRFVIVLMVVSSFWLAGLIFFSSIIPSSVNDQTSKTDGIVIFTGGKTRLQVALSLFESGKGQYLLISGVNPEANLSEMIKDIPHKDNITLGYDALNTEGNADETARWINQNNIKSIRLITSNYHMPRSLFQLRKSLPSVKILPHPVVGESFHLQKWWLNPSTLSLVVQEYNKFLFAYLGSFIEDIKYYLNERYKSA